MNADDGVVLAAIQIAEDPSTEATVPPRSSHVRLGDVSSFLIQQGVEERLMERPAARRRGGDGGGGFQQGFAKHRGKTKIVVGEGGQHRGTNVCGCPPSASLYIGG